MYFTEARFLRDVKQTGERKIYQNALLSFCRYSGIPQKARRVLYRLKCRPEDAEEIVQDATVIMVKAVQTGAYESRSKLSTYFVGVCKNLHANRGRAQKNKPPHLPLEPIAALAVADGPTSETEHRLDQHVLDELVSSLLALLSDRCQKGLELLYLSNYSLEQIGVELGYSSYDSAKSGLHKCLNRLRKYVRENAAAAQFIKQFL